MYNNLFEIDPMAGISYGMYNSIKGEEGSFLDFLLHYDSHEANNEDNSWFSDLINKDTMSKIKSPEVLEAMNFAGINTLDFLSSKSYFDTKAEALKLQLMQEMNKRNVEFHKDFNLYENLL
jgi:hypothetical protein